MFLSLQNFCLVLILEIPELDVPFFVGARWNTQKQTTAKEHQTAGSSRMKASQESFQSRASWLLGLLTEKTVCNVVSGSLFERGVEALQMQLQPEWGDRWSEQTTDGDCCNQPTLSENIEKSVWKHWEKNLKQRWQHQTFSLHMDIDLPAMKTFHCWMEKISISRSNPPPPDEPSNKNARACGSAVDWRLQCTRPNKSRTLQTAERSPTRWGILYDILPWSLCTDTQCSPVLCLKLKSNSSFLIPCWSGIQIQLPHREMQHFYNRLRRASCFSVHTQMFWSQEILPVSVLPSWQMRHTDELADGVMSWHSACCTSRSTALSDVEACGLPGVDPSMISFFVRQSQDLCRFFELCKKKESNCRPLRGTCRKGRRILLWRQKRRCAVDPGSWLQLLLFLSKTGSSRALRLSVIPDAGKRRGCSI